MKKLRSSSRFLSSNGAALFAALFITSLAASQTPPPLKAYADVVKDATTDPGVFTVHRIGDKVLFEIPKSQIGKEMLLNIEVAAAPLGRGIGGATSTHRVIRWTRRGNTLFLRAPNYSMRAEGEGAIVRAVESANVEPIMAAFSIETENRDGAVVIDVTRFFTSDPPEFSIKGNIAGGSVDPTRTNVDHVKAFPNSIELTSNMTFIGTLPANDIKSLARDLASGGAVGAATALVHYSVLQLPEKPMVPRLADSRVGYDTSRFNAYGERENRVAVREYITRFRLEKKDPDATLSEPVSPIVFTIGREVPEWLHPYLKAGVEDWNAAFEAAGFKNAIVCQDAPDDPNWDPDDSRQSVIRWLPTNAASITGNNVIDPRTGEILASHIVLGHNVMRQAQIAYFTQVGDLDPSAAKLPLPNPVLGKVMRYLVSQQIGESLGLIANSKGSSAYSASQLRDKTFTAAHGTSASVTDEQPFNYVAQPGDGADLIPKIGAYDRFAIEWGYRTFDGITKPEDETKALDGIAGRQLGDAALRFGHKDPPAPPTRSLPPAPPASPPDPTVQDDDLGSDPIEATRLGLLNIDRVAKMLVPAATTLGGNYDLLEETYSALLDQRSQELQNVANLVGGVVKTDFHAGRGRAVFVPVAPEKQAQAVKFLVENAFTTPTSLLKPEILTKIQPAGVRDRILDGQKQVLDRLLRPEQVIKLQNGGYGLRQCVSDVQSGIWSELAMSAPKADVYRRSLQRYYFDFLQARLKADDNSNVPTDLSGVVRASLRDLRVAIAKALPKTTDVEMRMHLIESRNTIDKILNPNA